MPDEENWLILNVFLLFLVFGCPGSLNGIGSNTSIAVEMSPEAGSWSKDPLYNTETIFFVPKSKQIVQVSRSGILLIVIGRLIHWAKAVHRCAAQSDLQSKHMKVFVCSDCGVLVHICG